jgi:hypothetical protein
MKTELSETEIRAIKEGIQRKYAHGPGGGALEGGAPPGPPAECGNNSPPGPGRVKEGMRGWGEDQRPLARAGAWGSFFSSRSRI